ncbi:MAG: hypothetical protein HFJ37_06465 [Clostridia bacterium]|nr:hypothetical protein [Clostridia bacterium]
MNLKSQKGYTGIDIAISVMVIFIFVSLIALLIYNVNSTSQKIELKSEATYIAIDEIEAIKNESFATYEERSVASGNSEEQAEVEGKEGFYKTIIVEDYTDIQGNENKIPNLVKKITVRISYMFQAKEQNIEISTILSKENEL